MDFDAEAENVSNLKEEGVAKQAIELEDAVQILKLLKSVEVKGV